ncbi:MAG: hypothetical protein AABY15_05750 [Nanoarchaeota archaeon]
MEDGFPLFDPNDEAARQEQKLREYYEEFSANARKRLLAKTIVRPTSVYDILYPQTREALLAKNVPFNTDLEEDSKIIRDKLIAKMVMNETDLEKISEDFRKSLLARARIQEDINKLTRAGEESRKRLVSKNVDNSGNLEKDSEQIRRDNIAKNKSNPSVQDRIDKDSASYRDNVVSKNVSKDQDLLRDSESFRNQFRINDIHKNVSKNSELEKDSVSFRKNNLIKNTIKNNEPLENSSREKRDSELAKNVKKSTDIEEDSISFRKDDISKNTKKDQDLLRDSENIRNQFRLNDLNKNVPSDSDIDRDNSAFRRNNLSKNISNNESIDKNSETFRGDNLSKNSGAKKSNIDDFAEGKRDNNLSKNTSNSSDIERDSIPFREDDLSKNVLKKSDIEKDSEIYRSDDLSLNKSKTTNLETDSAPFREEDAALNKPKTTNLETDSILFRKDDLSLNKPNESSLERDSIEIRKDNLSFNNPSVSNIEKDSKLFREDDLSLNKPNESNLETDSVPFREDDLSMNTPNLSNLETDSILFREDDLSMNTPSFSNLEVDSVPFREDDLSMNTPGISDLVVDSTPFLFNNLSANVPSTSDLAVDSVPFREDDLATNVPNFTNLLSDSNDFREDNLSSNIPIESSLAIDSVPFRADNLASNSPIDTNIALDSIVFRQDNLSANVPINSDLLIDSDTLRKDAIAKNSSFGLLGVNVEGAGTSAFLGISRVFTQGILIRQLLISKNGPKNTNLERDSYTFRVNNLGQNIWVPQAANAGASLEYGTSNTHFDLLLGTREDTGSVSVRAGFKETGGSPIRRGIEQQSIWVGAYNSSLQHTYGNFVPNPDGSIESKTISFSDKAYSVDTKNPQGGRFDIPTITAERTYWYAEGYVTENMRLYNVERNSFNIRNVQVGGLDGFGNLQSFAGDEEFQQLIASTVGALNVRRSVSTQAGTNTTPLSVIIANGGRYFKGDGDLLRPGVIDTIGSAESMMAKTILGNPFEDADFLAGRRGVKHIVNTIKQSSSQLAKNFDPQNNRAYITGVNRDGSPRVSRQRFTIANQYAPGEAGNLIFFIKNYSSGDQYYFPPYIQSISNTENANWNSTNFLGRPEAVYTYNNSSRDASISFYVLTDYAQRVDIGRNWNSETMEKVSADINGHFTQSDFRQNEARKLEEEKLQKLRAEQIRALSDINQKLDENAAESVNLETQSPELNFDPSSTIDGWASGVVNQFKAKQNQEDRKINLEKKNNKQESAALTREQNEINKELGNTNEAIGSVDADFNRPTNYSESNPTAGNIYNINITKKEFNNGEIICKPEDTINRIDTMKQNLMFQPSYFSGDKVDFVRKIEFLSKLTRPSSAYEGDELPKTGFSFIKPPVCHIHLGDWWNHDIIVNSVSFDYADAPWTLDGGRVQPMWALVTINFNIIGPFRAHNARPPLSTDKGGMFSPTEGIASA